VEFIDSGITGSKESRPALNRLLADAKRRRFDTVLVYRYDRFARSLRQLVNALAEFDARSEFISSVCTKESIPRRRMADSSLASSPQSRSLSAS
jgi:DNA invertase Pin-like site-specific DNA recombinase